MKVLVVYDSVHGNTEKIARTIGGAFAGEAEVHHAGRMNISESDTFDLIIVGSPTHGGRPTPAV